MRESDLIALAAAIDLGRIRRKGGVVEDALWPRASAWLALGSPQPALSVIGVPAHLTSISPTQAHTTPAAVRAALARYSTYHLDLGVDIAGLPARDLGDVDGPDGPEGEARVAAAVAGVESELLFAIGGDNSITYSVMAARCDLSKAGLVTLDAHFDLRDGISNGSPVRRLVEEGLNPRRIVQIGINNFSNSAAYAARARDYGITVITRDQVAERGITSAMERAFEVAGEQVYVDLDVDVCDRSVVPACPAAAPGGLSAHELRLAARAAGASRNVVAVDIAEIDAAADAPDQRTVRLGALCLLEVAAGRAATLNRTAP